MLVQEEKLRIFMEYIDGLTLKEFLIKAEANNDVALCEATAIKLGETICRYHNTNTVHGDLTTSNAIIRSKDNEIVLIDFGLACPTRSPEDMAVDLYVLERAFTSTHASCPTLFSHVIKGYEAQGHENPSSHAVLTRLDKVRKRGRKRMAIG
mmetsp:Transcript_1600/g.2324  ORF Transcript_1600/g.2324 Transcript_1600/m.2324 type:complete len:152 (-) Transcript_1600:312-767(-)